MPKQLFLVSTPFNFDPKICKLSSITHGANRGQTFKNSKQFFTYLSWLEIEIVKTLTQLNTKSISSLTLDPCMLEVLNVCPDG